VSSKADTQWVIVGQEIYGAIRQAYGHGETIARMIVIAPDVADWITEYAEVWRKAYEKA
jgi:hypothetical protein